MTDETGAPTTQLDSPPREDLGAADDPGPSGESAQVWERALGVLEDTVTPQQRAFMRLSRLDGVVERHRADGRPEPFAKDVLEARLRQVITAALSEQSVGTCGIAVVVDPSLDATAGVEPTARRSSIQDEQPGSQADDGGPGTAPASSPTPRAPGASPAPAGRASPPGSTRSTSSRPSSSARATGSPTPPRSRWPRRRPRRTTRCSSTATRAWARPTCCTRSGTTPGACTRGAGALRELRGVHQRLHQLASATARPTASAGATATSTSCWSTTSSSWRTRSGPRRSSSTPSTRCTTPTSRSSSPATARPSSCRRWRTGCATGSSGA